MSNISMEEITKEGVKGVRAVFRLQFPRQIVADTIWQVDKFTQYFPEILTIDILENSEKSQLIRYHVDAVYKKISYVLRRNRDVINGVDTISWRMTEGDLRKIIGSWAIVTEDQNRCRLIYESYVDASFLVPTTVIGKIAKTKLREMVQKVHDAAAAFSTEAS